MAKNEIKVETKNVDPININPTEVKAMNKKVVESAIQRLCDFQITKVGNMPKFEGQIKSLAAAEEILTAIKNGADFNGVSKLFNRHGWIPGGFSQGGAWFSRELQIQAGRVVDAPVLIVKTAGDTAGSIKEYEELWEYELRTGRAPEGQTYIGARVKCWSCGQEHVVKEMAHQLYCPDCDRKLQPKRGRGTGGLALTKMTKGQQELHSFAKAVFSQRNNEKMRDAMLAGLNNKRSACALSHLGTEDLMKAENFESLMK
jgi:hypothetical protein